MTPATERPTCCTLIEAACWLDAVTENALAGDRDALRILPAVVEHYLAVVQ